MHQPQGGIGSLDRHPARRTTQETDPPSARAPIRERTHGPLLPRSVFALLSVDVGAVLIAPATLAIEPFWA